MGQIPRTYVCNRPERKNSLGYEWYSLDDNEKATLIESFANSDAVIQRSPNDAASPIAAEVLEHPDFNSTLCFGNAKRGLINLVSAWGDKVHKYFCGFNHN